MFIRNKEIFVNEWTSSITNNRPPFHFQVLILSFDYQLSADRKYLLLAINYQKVSNTFARHVGPGIEVFVDALPGEGGGIGRNENFPRYYTPLVRTCRINFERADREITAV